MERPSSPERPSPTETNRLRRISTNVIARTRRTLSFLEPRRNLSFAGAILFVIGECAGSGILVLPRTIVDAGWAGMVLLLYISVTATYTGHLLTKCWTIVLDNYPADNNYIPYQAIGYRAFGHKGRTMVATLHSLCLCGVGTMSLVLASQILQTLVQLAGFSMSHCYWMLILAIFCCPLTWMGSSQYMNTIVVMCGLGTVLASLLILISTVIVRVTNPALTVVQHAPTIRHVLLGFGKMSFIFGGGHDAYPNVQSNAYQPTNMPWVILISHSVLILVYYPLAFVPYFTLGGNIKHDDVQVSLMALTNIKWPLIAANILILLHLLTDIIISLNPFLLEAEKAVGLRDNGESTDGSVRQILTRTMLFSTCLFIAQSLPNFAAIMALIGSSAAMLIAYVLPCVFYERLCQLGVVDERRMSPLPVRLGHVAVILLCGILGVGGTFIALQTLFGDATFVPPCYVNVTISKHL